MDPWVSKSRQQKPQRKGKTRAVRADREQKCEPPQCHSMEERHWWLHILEQFPESIWQTDYGYCWLLSGHCEACLCLSSCPQLTEGVTVALHWRDALLASPHVCSQEHQALCVSCHSQSPGSDSIPLALAWASFLSSTQGVLLKWSESSRKTYSTAINPAHLSWFLL